MTSATAFAPATVANVAVGFDILGFPVDAVGDEITVSRLDSPTVEIESIEGIVTELPRDPAKNTATAGLLHMIRDLQLPFGFRVAIKKNIPLGSGMGGSAASAVGAVVAANALLTDRLTDEQLFSYALVGEEVASGSAHPDNVSPCLLGGLTLTRSMKPFDVVKIPVNADILCVLVHPHLRVNTRDARAVLKSEVSMKTFVQQTANLAAFIAGCHQGDVELIRRSFKDVVIEPQRAPLIRGFAACQNAALEAGALGCTISGSGPSLCALALPGNAEQVKKAVIKVFASLGIASEGWVSSVRQEGAKVRPA